MLVKYIRAEPKTITIKVDDSYQLPFGQVDGYLLKTNSQSIFKETGIVYKGGLFKK